MSSPTSLSLPDVPDVLYAIFSFLDPVHHLKHEHDQVYESRRSLARAARTCRGFARPALDVLWKRLPDDQPLADLLCEVGIATRQDDEKDRQFLGEDKYVLPHQSGAMFFGSEEEEAYERQWRLSRGYDIRYVRVIIPFRPGTRTLLNTLSLSSFAVTSVILGNTLVGPVLWSTLYVSAVSLYSHSRVQRGVEFGRSYGLVHWQGMVQSCRDFYRSPSASNPGQISTVTSPMGLSHSSNLLQYRSSTSISGPGIIGQILMRNCALCSPNASTLPPRSTSFDSRSPPLAWDHLSSRSIALVHVV